MDLGIRGKKALVFGGSSGLGLGVAEALAREGVKVAIVARDEKKLFEAAGKIGASLALSADLSKAGEATRVTNQVLEQWGQIDILVTNTGGPPRGAFNEVSLEQWQQGFQSLWLSAVEAFRAVLPSMQKNKWGRIMLVTSMSAREPLPRLTVSNGLRAGLVGLAKSMSAEYAPFGITINALLPGYTNTERVLELGIPLQDIAAKIPAGRLATTQEFGAMAAFLASEQAGYITGQAIAVDGGFIKGI